MKAIFVILAALAGAPAPAPEYRAPISEETAAEVLEIIINDGGEATAPAPAALDFNGDGALNIADYYGISRRHYISTHDRTEITLDREAAEAIAAELYPEDIEAYFYYEIDHINGDLCRQYETTAAEVTDINIYFEFEEKSTSHRAELNPYTETITIF